MIDARELRIGNYVFSKETQECQMIVGITLENPFIDAITFDYTTYDEIEPIPLTEQWLIDFGFVKFGDNSSFYLGCYEKGFIFDRYDSTQARIWWRGRYLGICQRLVSVHQLQNLYFALTGQELTKK